MSWFKRKKKEETYDESILIEQLVNWIKKAKELSLSDEEIRRRFKDKGYSKDLISLVFEIYKVKGGLNKMVIKKKKEVEEEESEDELEEEVEEEESEDDEDSEPEKPKKPVKKEVEETSKDKLTPEQVTALLTNHEQRLQAFETRLTSDESRFFRAGI